MSDTQDYPYECANCPQHVPFEGMRCTDCFVGTTEQYLFDHVPEFAETADDDPNLPNLRAYATTGTHIALGIYDRKGGPEAPGTPEWIDQMLELEQAEALIDALNEAIEQTDRIPHESQR